jgi:cell surface protein SprA
LLNKLNLVEDSIKKVMTNQLLKLTILFGLISYAATLSATDTWDWGKEANFSPKRAASFSAPLDSLKPIETRSGDFINNPNTNPFDLNDPSVIEKKVEYDPATGLYLITEKVGNTFFRPPTYMTFEEYVKWSAAQQQRSYFQQLGRNSSGNSSDPLSKFDLKNAIAKRSIFGANESGETLIDIKPQGNIDMTFGGDFQRIDNPILTERQRRQGGFNFDMNIQMNVQGTIGSKMKLQTNYNTQASFDFENQVKLEYAGDEDQILQKIEAGNVSLPLRSTLIQGSQSLFGVKTEMQFGRLRVTSVMSQQKSRRKNLQIQGGAQQQRFQVSADQYDENRHFFLSHYNRDKYETALRNLPQVNTLFRITKMEMWVTNTRNATQDVRDIVAIADLGEGNPTKMHNDNPLLQPTAAQQNYDLDRRTPLPFNRANPIYEQMLSRPDLRALDNAVVGLQGAPFSLEQVKDFQKVRARKLAPSEYDFHPELGFVSLNVTLQPDDVLGVAFEYTYNGKVYQVGEFSIDAPINPDTLSVLYVKMLRSTTPRVDLPIWDLMMKNVYSIGAYQVNQQDFTLDVFYQDPGGAAKRFIPESSLSGKPLLRVLNLDNLNRTGDPVPDGAFDFVPGVTINPRNGRIIFPVLEPFGKYLSGQFEASEDNFKQKYVYSQLYDSTAFVAREYPEYNRFVIQGTYKSSVSAEISLGAFNIPRNSVTVTAGGQQLVEGTDYTVDYNIGRIKVINEGVLNSGLPVNVSFEDNSLFSFQTRTLIGSRLDYWISDDFSVGGTVMRLSERPFTQKVNIGDDPIANTVYGLDIKLQKDAPWLTRLVDALPLIDTKAPSRISLDAEGALLRPDHPNVINQGLDEGGASYLDDFEGSSSAFDMRNPAILWTLASVPDNSRFPEARLVDSLVHGFNRAKLSWYQIDQSVRVQVQGAEDDPYTRLVREQEVFPNRAVLPGQNVDIRPLDLAYYPSERGPYNYETNGVAGISAGLNPDGTLRVPSSRWAGIQRAIQTNNFEAANIEFVEFWLLNPFIGGSGGSSGKLYLNLGSISEDVLKDSRLFFENGLPREDGTARTDFTSWGRVPRTQAVTNAFDNDPATRDAQDVGLDGLDNTGERSLFSRYLTQVQAILNPDVLARAQEDPSNDDYLYYNDASFDENTPMRERYFRFNNGEGNSRSPQGNELSAATNIPDSEDINNDNTLSETEAYYQYEIPLQNDGTNEMALTRYVTDFVETTPGQRWYQFRVPIDQFTSRHGGIQDFRSIRFMRLYLTEFEEPVVLRFARLSLVRNQWRRYRRNLMGGGIFHPIDPDNNTAFDMIGVSIEENASKVPFPYVLPPGVERERTIGTIANAQQNEQALALRVCNLEDGDARAVFKTLNLDMRVFNRMKMFVHAESDENLQSGELTMFVRLGSDFENNYYEYEIPLTMTPPNTVPTGTPNDDENYKEQVWLDVNSLDITLEDFRNLKVLRDREGASLVVPFERTDEAKPNNRLRIVGNPDLGLVEGMMIGIRNPKNDGVPKCAEVWVNELRVTGFDERGGYAGRARLDMTLADFGQISASGNYTSIGWGSLEQRVAERAREEVFQYDIAGSFQMDKFLPKKYGVRLPLYAQFSQTLKTPEYDPYKFDIPLKQLVDAAPQAARDSLMAQARTITTIKSVNMTNVRKERTNTDKKPQPWDIENVSVSAAFSETENSDPTIVSDAVRLYRGGLDYAYSTQPTYIVPFQKIIKSENKHLKIIKDFNFSPFPNSITFNTGVNRRFSETTYRFAGDDANATWFDKRFMWDRVYSLQWNLSRGLNVNFNATNNAVIDEPTGRIDTQEKRDSIMTNLRNFGRTKNYTHSIAATYTLPLKKIPILDWATVKATYNANYSWSAAALNLDSLGNVIQNGNSRQLNADLNFEQLYNKSKYLKKINAGKPPKRTGKKEPKELSGDERAEPDGAKPTDDKKKKKEKEPTDAARALLRPLMLVRKGRFSYSQDYTSAVPGFKPISRVLGQSEDMTAPGWEYIAGFRPSDAWLDDAATQGWITNNIFLNQQFLSSYTENVDARLTIEPFKEFRIEMEATRAYSENYSEFFKVQEVGGTHQHLTPREVGTYTVSFFAMRTMFAELNQDFVSATFKQFEANRSIISQRIGSEVPHPVDGAPYSEGYGRFNSCFPCGLHGARCGNDWFRPFRATTCTKLAIDVQRFEQT